MAATTDTLKAKERKQKRILAVAGALMLVLGLIQGPKLWKQLNPPPPPPVAAPAPVAAGDGSAAPATDGAAPAPVVASGPATLLAGVRVASAGRPRAAEGHLWSFSRFADKDPFVQQVVEQGPPGSEPTLGDTQGPASSASSGADGRPGGGGAAKAGGGSVAAPGSATGAPVAAKPTNATIAVNGAPEQLELKGTFPKAAKAFVLVSLERRAARIGVAGGSFVKGETVKLILGKPLTLVNRATGARYVVELLYTGATAEQVQGFTKGSK